LLQIVLFLATQSLNDLGSILLVYLSFQQLVLLFGQLDLVIQLFVLASHLLSHEFEQVCQLFASLAQRNA
jgi:hypothetical protein